jgi:hypothetical protein
MAASSGVDTFFSSSALAAPDAVDTSSAAASATNDRTRATELMGDSS